MSRKKPRAPRSELDAAGAVGRTPLEARRAMVKATSRRTGADLRDVFPPSDELPADKARDIFMGRRRVKAEPLPRILCPFCSAPWTPDMIRLWNTYAQVAASRGYRTEVSTHLDIKCKSCKRLIYRKEIVD